MHFEDYWRMKKMAINVQPTTLRHESLGSELPLSIFLPTSIYLLNKTLQVAISFMSK